MKTTLLTLLVVLTASFNVAAQKLIAVQNGGTPTFYSNVTDAVTNAQSKDTIYIPGGSFTFPNNALTINKELHLIGVGHNPDSTLVDGKTLLNATINLVSVTSNNSSFEGFKLNGDFTTGSNNTANGADNITISRCNVINITLTRYSKNWTVYENVIRGSVKGFSYISSVPHSQNNSFVNNIFDGQVYSFGPNNEFKNNIFRISGSDILNYIDGSQFQNNIFSNASFSNLTSCTFYNNLYFSNFVIPSSNTGNNNIINQVDTDTFVNATSSGNFNYTDDYHLKATSPGKSAGYDGTDIGIYGGVFPWKVGSIPSNPHFQTATIAPKTDNAGLLNVKITVSAQDN